MTDGTRVTPNSSFQIVSRESILVERRTSSTRPPSWRNGLTPRPAAPVGTLIPPPGSASYFVAVGYLTRPLRASLLLSGYVRTRSEPQSPQPRTAPARLDSGGQRHTERCGLHQLPIGTRAALDDDAATCRGKLRERDAGRRFHARDCLLTADASQATRRRCKKMGTPTHYSSVPNDKADHRGR